MKTIILFTIGFKNHFLFYLTYFKVIFFYFSWILLVLFMFLVISGCVFISKKEGLHTGMNLLCCCRGRTLFPRYLLWMGIWRGVLCGVGGAKQSISVFTLWWARGEKSVHRLWTHTYQDRRSFSGTPINILSTFVIPIWTIALEIYWLLMWE